MALIETSALDSSNVSLAFELIIKGKFLTGNYPRSRDLSVAACADAGRSGAGIVNERIAIAGSSWNQALANSA